MKTITTLTYVRLAKAWGAHALGYIAERDSRQARHAARLAASYADTVRHSAIEAMAEELAAA